MNSLITQNQYDEIIGWFQEGGKIIKELGCSPRPSQQIMVDYVTGVLDSGKSLLCEAPTGVGKTYSYLFPLAATVANYKHTTTPIKVVVSTSTKSLQRQLRSKDFPALNKLFPNVKTHVWMGASNYLCGVRLAKAARKTKLDPEVRQEIHELMKVAKDLKKLPHGWREELPFKISDKTWEEICGETKPCCLPDDIKQPNAFCHKRNAFFRALESDILCVNHSLLCNLALYVGGLHPNNESPSQLILVVDEAHDLEENLRRCLNQSFSFSQLRRHIGKINNDIEETQFLNELNMLRDDINSQLQDEPLVVENASTPLGLMLTDLGHFIKRLAVKILDSSNNIISTGTQLTEEDLREIQGIVKGLNQQSKELLAHLATLDESKMLEIGKGFGSKSTDPVINFALFSLADQFKNIWAHSRQNILTSATLFNADAETTKEQYQLPDAEIAVIPPNFSYGKVIKAFYNASREKKSLENTEIADWIKPALKLSEGNSLVLFTSYKSMNEVYSMVRAWASQQGYKLLIQSKEHTPGDLIKIMETEHNTILFGTNTFWTGIDVKGANLSSVIITKLPFRMLDNYSKKFSVYLESKGLNPFSYWSVPDMITKTRQGIGRLIRDDHDKGLVFVLDPRFGSTYYGHTLRHKIFADSGKTTLNWIKLEGPEEIDVLAEAGIKEWLGVTTPKTKTNSTSEYNDEPFQEDDNIPF